MLISFLYILFIIRTYIYIYIYVYVLLFFPSFFSYVYVRRRARSRRFYHSSGSYVHVRRTTGRSFQRHAVLFIFVFVYRVSSWRGFFFFLNSQPSWERIGYVMCTVRFHFVCEHFFVNFTRASSDRGTLRPVGALPFSRREKTFSTNRD